MTMQQAILAGGCFWGMEELFRHLPGVTATDVGYTGGSAPNPTYKSHDGHAEAIRVTFDPTRISYAKLLEFFFQIHDPTTVDRQGNDRGSSYRSAIFFADEAQKATAETVIAQVNASGKWPAKVVTELTPASAYYLAEGYHQNYLQNFPDGYTCHFVRPNWKLDNTPA